MGAEEDLVKKYKDSINKQHGGEDTQNDQVIRSSEFSTFKEYMKKNSQSLYEKACKFCEILNFPPPKDKIIEIEKNAAYCRLNVTPKGVMGFAVLCPMVVWLLGCIFTYILWESYFYLFVFTLLGLIMIFPLMNVTQVMAKQRRLKGSNQMILATFYIVTYMRHTSNLELAINFAAEHLGQPLATDFNSIIWDVESGKYPSLKEALDIYLEDWKKDALEFVESTHMIESSLYEVEDIKRVQLLDKALNVMLEETYEKMIHYAHSLQSPITMLHMMGVILPILGLVMLPLLASFMEGVQWYHIMAIYNFAFPGMVFYLGWKILSERPSGGGSSDDAIANSPELKKFQKLVFKIGNKEVEMSPFLVCLVIFIVLFVIGLIPVIVHTVTATDTTQDFDVGFLCNKQTMMYLPESQTPATPGDWDKCKFIFLQYRMSKSENTDYRNFGKLVGPFGILSSIISLAFPLAFALSFGLYFRIKTSKVIEIRNRSRKLEAEFSQGLFQLGNRLGDGIPVELAFGKIADIMEGTTTGDFFRLVSNNIMQLGMGVYDAIFDPERGALVYYPSNVIESSMKVLVESSKKGPDIAANAVTNVSQYIKEMHRVEERLRDLMAETTSSMKSQVSFMTPAITGIVIGITSMITTIMGNLTSSMNNMGGKAGGAGIANILGGDGIPTYFFQMVVGVYVVEVTYILTILSNGITNGSDTIQEQYDASKNLIRSTILYSLICIIIMILFNIIASSITQGIQ